MASVPCLAETGRESCLEQANKRCCPIRQERDHTEGLFGIVLPSCQAKPIRNGRRRRE